MTNLLPSNETERLHSLQLLKILDTDAEQEFDDLTRLAAQICGVPISAISLIDEHRQWFKSKVGLEADETPREQAFCAHAILGDDLFIVPNAARDDRFVENPLVTGDSHIRFYAGAPLITEDGSALGSLCVIDRTPRQLSPEQKEALRALARQATKMLELRKDSVALNSVNEELKASEESYRIVSESASDAIITIDENSRIVFVNKAVEKVFGYSAEEMVGSELSLIVPERLRAAHSAGMRRYMQTSKRNIPWNGITLPAVRRDGEEIQIEISFGEYRQENKRFFTAVIRDITERQRIEAKMRESEQRYRFLAESVPQQVWTANANGQINYGNQRTIEYFGQTTQKELFDMQWTKIVHPDDMARTGARWTKAVETGEPYENEYRLRRKDGEYRWHLAQATPMFGEDGNIIKWFGTNTDIHDRKIAEESVKKSEAYRNLFKHANDAILIFEPESEIILDASDRALQMYGRRREDFIGRSLKDMSKNESRGAQELGKLIHDGVYDEFESVHLRGDGTPIDLVINASVIDYQGKKAILTINRDVTNRKKMEVALREREEHFRLLVEGVENYAIFMIDPKGYVVSWNAGAGRLKGYSAQEIIGQHFSVFYSPEDQARNHPENELQTAVIEGRYQEEGWRIRKDGTQFLANVLITALRDESGELKGFSKITHDVTERKLAEIGLRESQERYQLLFDSNPHPAWVYDLETLKILAVNEEAVRSYGYSKEEFLQLTLEDLRPSEDIPVLLEQVDQVQQLQTQTARPSRHRKKNGSVIDVEIASQPINFGDRRARLVLATDVTMRKRAEEQLLHNALHDALTGLPNRALFLEHLRHAIERNGIRGRKIFAVLFLDFDHFKVINDSLGHMEGDNLLKLIAERLSETLRPGDIVARLGGDEFTILLDDLGNSGDVMQIAERIQDNLKLPFNLRRNEVFISASIGIALNDQNYSKPEIMLRDADIAMYRAKAGGKARHEVFNKTMHEQVSSRLQLETELRQAVEREEFRVFYQPIINLQTERAGGFESLIRWQHPVRGIVSPLEFIPVAEETGLIIQLGLWILRESCRQLRVWQNERTFDSPLTMSVNLSSKQFAQPDLVEQIGKIINETRIEPGSLRLEITESHLMEDSEAAIKLMNCLRSAGVKLSIDDFGTGYSSLSYLHRLPVNYLKVDRSFVSRMHENSENREIVRTIISLAKNLHLEVVAEGIETVDQANYLKSLACEFGQGYYYSKPVDASIASELITKDFSDGAPSIKPSDLIFQLVNETKH